MLFVNDNEYHTVDEVIFNLNKCKINYAINFLKYFFKKYCIFLIGCDIICKLKFFVGFFKPIFIEKT